MEILPTQNNLPDLSHLSLDRVLLRLQDTLTGDRGREFEDRVLMSGCARLVDRAIADYNQARGYIEEYLAPPPGILRLNLTGFYRAVSALEQTINTAHRAAKCAGALAERGVIDETRLRIHEGVTDIRDAIEHFDERVVKPTRKGRPRIEPGDSPFLSPSDRGLIIGKHSLSYEALADTLISLHDAVGNPLK